jgi:hypothetical protein
MSRVTLREQLIAGLEALGHQRPRRPASTRFVVFDRGDGRYWFVGISGALRTGRTLRASMPAPARVREYVLTAPQVRPVVFGLLDRAPPEPGAKLEAVAVDLATKPTLAGVSVRTILNHVSAWAKQRQGDQAA